MEYQDPKIPELGQCSAVLTVELDPETFSPDSLPPGPLDRESAARVAGHIAGDMQQLFGDLSDLSLVLPGALYDQTELLRPGFPILDALDNIFRGTLVRGGYKPQVIALGTDSGPFPVAVLNPACQPGAGPLLLLPFMFAGRKLKAMTLSSNLENTLLAQGTASEATIAAVQEAFGVQAVNMSYATVNDLCALLKVQLENSDFAPLWELLEHALFQRAGVCRVALPSGNVYLLADGAVYAPYYTFDDWAQFGPGRDLPAAELAEGYSQWVRCHRQYTLTLNAYGLPVHYLIASPSLEQDDAAAALVAAQAATPLGGDFVVETLERTPSDTQESRLIITNQYLPALGTLAYTVVALDAAGRPLTLEHYYPLSPHGLSAIIDSLIQRSDHFGVARQVMHPRTLVYSLDGRCLEPANDEIAPSDERRH